MDRTRDPVRRGETAPDIPRLLLIGGTDSSCGAGLARDLETAAQVGVGVRMAVTAVTAQDGQGVRAISAVPPKVIGAQITAAGDVAAVKIGMVGTTAAIEAITRTLPRDVPVVVDPVLAASAGGALLQDQTLAALIRLCARAQLVTPNRPEARTLSGTDNRAEQAAFFLSRGAGAVLIKGGHDSGPEAVDHLYTRQGHRSFHAPRKPGARRGTGCALATAIAGFLGQGHPLDHAIARAKDHLIQSWPV